MRIRADPDPKHWFKVCVLYCFNCLYCFNFLKFCQVGTVGISQRTPLFAHFPYPFSPLLDCDLRVRMRCSASADPRAPRPGCCTWRCSPGGPARPARTSPLWRSEQKKSHHLFAIFIASGDFQLVVVSLKLSKIVLLIESQLIVIHIFFEDSIIISPGLWIRIHFMRIRIQQFF